MPETFLGAADIDFPASLGKPLQPLNDTFPDRSFSSGVGNTNAIVKHFTGNYSHVIIMNFAFDEEQYNTFKTFYATTLANGRKFFNITVDTLRITGHILQGYIATPLDQHGELWALTIEIDAHRFRHDASNINLINEICEALPDIEDCEVRMREALKSWPEAVYIDQETALCRAIDRIEDCEVRMRTALKAWPAAVYVDEETILCREIGNIEACQVRMRTALKSWPTVTV